MLPGNEKARVTKRPGNVQGPDLGNLRGLDDHEVGERPDLLPRFEDGDIQDTGEEDLEVPRHRVRVLRHHAPPWMIVQNLYASRITRKMR